MFNTLKKFVLSSPLFLFSLGGSAQILNEGVEAPDFTLEDMNGHAYTLSSYKNISPVIIYFYPKANTPGCTKQACGIRDNNLKFTENNIPVFGISTDSKDSLKKFSENYNLNFPLLSDEDKSISKLYGVLNNFGFANRVTFIIDKKGIINKLIKVSDISIHADEVLKIALQLK